MPAALLDNAGNPLPSATYSGETVVFCNSQDASVARGTAGNPPPPVLDANGNVVSLSPGYAPSLWETL